MDASFEARNGYLYVRAVGEFTLAGARKVLAALVEKAQVLGLDRILADVTALAGFDGDQASTLTRYDLGVAVTESLQSKFQMAILETPGQIRGGRFGETVMRNRGGLVKVTTSLGEALDWLKVAGRGNFPG